MNSRLKFRAWDKKLKSFVNHDKLAGYFGITFDGKIMYTAPFMDKDFSEQLELEQYTGLKDKNGKDIFEGDIVKYATKKVFCETKKCEENESILIGKHCPDCGKKLEYKDFVITAKVSFSEGGFCFEYHNEEYDTIWATYCAENYIEWKEVVGNIHQNTDLLK